MSSRISAEWRSTAPGIAVVVLLAAASEYAYSLDTRIGFLAQLSLIAGAFLFFIRTTAPTASQVVYQRVVMALVPLAMARFAFVVVGGIDWPTPALTLAVAVVVMATLIGIGRSGRVSARTFGFSSRLWFIHAPLGIAAGVGAGRLATALVSFETLDLEGWSTGTGVAVAAVALVAVTDDLMYRGLLLGTLTESIGLWAIVVTAALYGLGFAGFDDPATWGTMAVIGLGLGVWRLASGSVIGSTAASIGVAMVTLVPWPLA